MGRKTFNVRRPSQRSIAGKDFQLAEEISYMQRRAAEHDARLVTVGPLGLFSTDSGDAWLLDAADQLAVRLSRDRDPEDVYFEETETRFAVGCTRNYRIDGSGNGVLGNRSRRTIPFLIAGTNPGDGRVCNR